MIAVPLNANSIYVSMVQTGCCAAEFDSTYPIHLNGIISQHEFQESINKINSFVSSSRTSLIMCWIIFGLSMIVGTTCFSVSGATVTSTVGPTFFVLIAVGTFLTSVGSIVFGISVCVIHSRRITRMRQAVAEESMKYSSRSPVPCSWRIDSSRTWGGPYGNQNNNLAYHLVIDIGRSVSLENENQTRYSNKVAPASISNYTQQNDYPPPAYVVQSTGSCPQCNALRQDLSAKFCSSCGYSFNRY